MKNLFLTLAFVFVITLSFASDNSINDHSNKPTRCVTVHTSCGITGIVCASDTPGLIEAAIDLDSWGCPSK